MSLGLVSYDDSEESENESDSHTASDENVTLVKNTVPLSSSISAYSKTFEATKKETDDIPAEFIDKKGPIKSVENPVNIHIPESKISTLNTDIDINSLTSTNRRNGPVKITIPSLNEVEEDAEPPSKKKLKPSQKGSGLFALLPNPKSCSLIPQAIKNKNHSTTNKQPKTVAQPNKSKIQSKVPVVNKLSLTTYEDSGEEDEPSGPVDFFSLENKEEIDIMPAPVDINIDLHQVTQPSVQDVPLKDNNDDGLNFNPNFQPNSLNSWPSASNSSVNQPIDHYTTAEFISCSNSELELGQEAMQQLCGRRDRFKMQEVNIIDVSGDAIMPDSREWLTKQLTEEQTYRTSHKKKDGPTSQQKRKHQITYLAYQAKENELELKNQWANNRMSRKQTQAKYGF